MPACRRIVAALASLALVTGCTHAEPATHLGSATRSVESESRAEPRPAPTPALVIASPAPPDRSEPMPVEVKTKAEVRASRNRSTSMLGGSSSPGITGELLHTMGAGAPSPTKALPSREERDANTEDYKGYGVNPMTATAEDHLSTFAVDVDTASYAIVRRKLLEGALPPPSSVRVEEFLNYFKYAYPAPETAPFAVHLEAAPSPFTPGRHLVRVGLQGKTLSLRERKSAHLTFLVDVSGSMSSPDKLPLAKKALRILVDNLKDGDTVALVTYAGNVREVLPPTGLERKAAIHAAIEDLSAGGSTAMSSGIDLAYRQAAKTLSPDSISRVIILSDGDANVGNTSHDAILRGIAGHVSEGVTLSTVGFGMGNYKDTMMEQLANKGNGNYFYIDSAMQARRVFQEQLGGTLEVIAKDVKVQVDFNPDAVARYRLVGYENRDIRDQDFRNDRVDAGEIGAGHSVTALYEVELTDRATGTLATVRIRAKKPRGETAEETAQVLQRSAIAKTFADASPDLRFAAAVMGAAEIFRRSPAAREWSLERVLQIAKQATPQGSFERQEFCELVKRSQEIRGLGSVAAR